MSSQELEFIKTTKGKKCLIVAGYAFYKDYEYQGTTYWKCCNFRSLNCKARAHTANGGIIKSTGTHNHAADAAKLVAQGIVNNIKAQAVQCNDPPQKIVSSLYSDAPEPVAVQLPRVKNVKQTIRRVRNVVRKPPSLPRTRADLDLGDCYTFTKRGEQFLLYDKGKVDDRILIFATKRNLHFLAQCDEWYSDGTFKVCPEIFAQFYTIHIIKNHTTIPLVFALLPNKSQITYIEFLSKLKEIEPQLNPSSILLDLEYAAINAYKTVFPEICIRLCNFHFKQCLYRHIQTLGLKENYDKDVDFARNVKMIAALAYVKPDDVESSFLILDKSMPEILENFLDYFGKQFIGYIDLKGRKKSGKFPIEEWNLYNNLDLPKTNNFIEGWHRSFNGLVQQCHPSIWKFIEFLQTDQGKNEVVLQQIFSGREPGSTTKKIYIDLWKRIKNIVDRYEDFERMDYLKSIADNILI